MRALDRFRDLLVSVACAVLSVFAMILLVLLGDPTFPVGLRIHLIPEAIALFAMGFSLGTLADLFSWSRKAGWLIVIAVYSVTVMLFSIWTGIVHAPASITFGSWLLLGYSVQRILNVSARRVMVNMFFVISAMIVASLTFLGVFFISGTIILTIIKDQNSWPSSEIMKFEFFLSTLLAIFCSLIVLSHLIFFSKRIKPSRFPT